MNLTRIASLTAATAVVALLAAAQPQDLKSLKGPVRVDGSSTVLPISEAVMEEFATPAPNVNVTVGRSGTGGGFKRFTVGEIEIADASRPIRKAEADMAVSRSIEFIELPIAYDGLTVVVNKQNDWAKQLTMEQIKKLFSADTAAKTWKDLDSAWPAETIKIYSPGTDSGTFDYFREVVVGKDGKIRSDMSVSEDDNVIVRGVEGDKNSIGFFGYAYYVPNKEKLNDVWIVNPKTKTAVEPTPATIENGSYAPFSRPLFIYVNKTALAKPHVAAFVDFYLDNAGKLSKEVGYVPLPSAIYERAKANVKAQRVGSQFIGPKGESLEGALTDLYK
jgi:phosphate transport system substrate-binding protein